MARSTMAHSLRVRSSHVQRRTVTVRQPTFDSPRIVSTLETSHGGREDVLHDVFDPGLATEKAQRESADVARVTLVEFFEDPCLLR